jgi:restriction system protein
MWVLQAIGENMDDQEDETAILLLKAAADRRKVLSASMAAFSESREKNAAFQSALMTPGTAHLLLHPAPPTIALPELALQTVIHRLGSTPDGHLVEAVLTPWIRLLASLKSDPNAMYQISPRELEELIAAAYDLAGFDEVILTPRSGDRGRDVIATKKGVVQVRVLDQAKRYAHGHEVSYDAIRAFLFVLAADRASKGFITTTSCFPPNLMTDQFIAPKIGNQLELIDGSKLVARLEELAGSQS